MPFFFLCFGFFNLICFFSFFFKIPSDAKGADDKFTKVAFWGRTGDVSVCLCACFTHPRAGCSSIYQQVISSCENNKSAFLGRNTEISFGNSRLLFKSSSLLVMFSREKYCHYYKPRGLAFSQHSFHRFTSICASSLHTESTSVSLWELCDFVRSVTTQQHTPWPAYFWPQTLTW